MKNGIRIVSVTGDVSEDDPKAAQQVMETLENEILPDLASKYQIEWQLAGLSEQEDRFLNVSTHWFDYMSDWNLFSFDLGFLRVGHGLL